MCPHLSRAGATVNRTAQSLFCIAESPCYARFMENDRMMQAIGRIERALSRIETAGPFHTGTNTGVETGSSRADIAAALKSLDALIGDLRKTDHG